MERMPFESVGESPKVAAVSASMAEAVPVTGPTALPETAQAVPPSPEAQAVTTGPDAADVPVAAPARHRHRPTLRPVRIGVRVHTIDSLRHRNFRLLWTATLLAGGAGWTHQVVIGWLIFYMTQSALLTSLALGLGALPFLFVGPVAGVLVDGWDRRKLLALSFGYQATITAGFAGLLVMGRIETWHMFAFVLATGLSSAILHPATTSLLPNTVPRESLLNAFALSSLAFNVTRLTVPAVGGLSIALMGPGRTVLLAVALLLGATMATLALRVEDTSEEGRRPRSVARFLEGARYIKGEPLVLAMLLMGVLPTILVFPFVQGLMPVYASQVFGAGPVGLGLLLSALGAGATMGTFLLASVGNVRHKGRILFVALALTTALMVAFSRSTSMGLALPILMFFGGSLSSFFTVSSASIQSIVPDRLRGRVSSLAAMSLGLMPVGGLLAGGLAELVGAPSATLAAGALLAAIWLGLSLKLRPVWRFG